MVCRHDGKLAVCSLSNPILIVDQTDKMEIKLLHFTVTSIFLSESIGSRDPALATVRLLGGQTKSGWGLLSTQVNFL
jgi:hypothetical protein